MGALVGFALGYVIGSSGGDDGWKELREAWHTISTSEEVRDLLVGGFAMARDLARQGAGIMAERLATVEQPPLRRAA